MKISATPLVAPVLFIAFISATFSIAQKAAPPRQSSAIASYGNLPLLFETNEGQSNPSVQFLTRGQGYTLFLRQGEAVLALRSNASSPSSNSSAQPPHMQPSPLSPERSIIRMELVGANPHAEVIEEDKQITTTNYFLGKNPNQWHTGISNYGRIRYRSVYDGIDQVYYGNQRQLEHDFVLRPQADAGQIILALHGAKKLHIDSATGDLILETGSGELRLRKPLAYQEEANDPRAEVSSGYKLLAGNKVAFSIGHYDRTRPLIIDPVLTFSTYLGGTGSDGDQGNGIAVDSAGEAFIVGTTYSVDFPVTSGAFQPHDNAASGLTTVFVTKLNAAGTALIYSTYLGGSGGDFGYGIALDASKNAYITGATRSNDFPVTCGAYETANPSTTTGATVAFVARLVADGSALSYSTYLGGSGNQSSLGDVAQGIAVDTAGDAYVSGYTYSSDFPVSDTAFQKTYAGSVSNSNAFATKLNPSGTSLLYSTYLGGSGSPAEPFVSLAVGDSGNAIAIDSLGDAYIAGSTASGNFPVTSSAFQTTLLGPFNTFVTELNPDGSAEMYSTYLGGSGQYPSEFDSNSPPATGDSANAIAVDAGGNAYVAGNTTSTDFPVTAGVLEGASDFDSNGAFVTRLNTGGSTLKYSTYLEGVGTSITGLAVDNSGVAYVTGNVSAASAGLPGGFQATPDALPPPASIQNSAFVVKLDPSATVLNYATLLGGSANDGATAIAIDPAGNAYLTGKVTSTDFPVTSGAFQTTNKGATTNGNAFVSQMALASEANTTTYPPLPSAIATTVVNDGSSIVDLQCFPDDYSADSFSFIANVTLNAATAGPPLTGEVVFTDNWNYAPNGYQIQFSGPSGIGFTFMDVVPDDAPLGPLQVNWTVSYSGDAVYAPSSVSGTATSPGCPPPSGSVKGTARKSPGRHVEVQMSTPQGTSSSTATLGEPSTKSSPVSATFVKANAEIFGNHGAKFIPPPARPRENGQGLNTRGVESSQDAPACLAPPQTATPTFSPAAGTYTSVQSVTISDATAGTTIYYTTDGTTPSASSTPYTAAISVGVTETIQAIAIAPGYSISPVASAAYTINLPPATFSVTVSPTSLTILPGQSGSATISITPQNGFASATTFSCSGLPSGVTCTFSPATVTPTAGAATTMLTVSASQNVGSLRNSSRPPFSGKLPGATLAIALWCFSWKKRRTVKLLLLALATVSFGATLLIGCGGKSTPSPMTSTVTVTATSGSIHQTVPLSVTIQ